MPLDVRALITPFNEQSSAPSAGALSLPRVPQACSSQPGSVVSDRRRGHHQAHSLQHARQKAWHACLYGPPGHLQSPTMSGQFSCGSAASVSASASQLPSATNARMATSQNCARCRKAAENSAHASVPCSLSCLMLGLEAGLGCTCNVAHTAASTTRHMCACALWP